MHNLHGVELIAYDQCLQVSEIIFYYQGITTLTTEDPGQWSLYYIINNVLCKS